MNKEVKDYIKRYKSYVTKQIEYIEGKPWYAVPKGKSSEHKVQFGITSSALTKIEYLLTKVDRYERAKYKTIQKFIELLATPAFLYIANCDTYLELNKDWDTINDAKARLAEINFQDSIQNNVLEIQKKLHKLNIENTVNTVDIPIFGDKQIPFLMKEIMERRYPEILEYIKDKEVTKNQDNYEPE